MAPSTERGLPSRLSTEYVGRARRPACLHAGDDVCDHRRKERGNVGGSDDGRRLPGHVPERGTMPKAESERDEATPGALLGDPP